MAGRCARHTRGGLPYDSAMRALQPRPDGISNTITTVIKDNYLLTIERI